MDVDAFVVTHRSTWTRLEDLVNRRNKLTGAEVDELVDLYQRVSTHLSMVRSSSTDSVLVGRLSALVARARSAVTGAHAPLWSDIARFWTVSFPVVAYRAWRWWLATAVVFFAVAVVIGEGSSGGALALGVADRVVMLENSTYSVISPEGAAAILWRDAGKAKLAAQAFKPTAANCYRWGIADAVVPEPDGGAHSDHDEAARLLDGYLSRTLRELGALPVHERRRLRRERFRRLGAHRELPPDSTALMAQGADRTD